MLLDKGRENSIVWVTGPPGAGKTTLVAQYIETFTKDSIWYQLDQGDTDVATCFHYLHQAVATPKRDSSFHLPTFTPQYLSDLAVFSRSYFREIFSCLESPFAMVFDNYHEVAAQSRLHEVMQAALEEDVHVALPGEADAPVQLHSIARDLHEAVAQVRLGVGRHQRCLPGQLRKRVGSVPDQRARRLELRGHLGAHVFHRLERADQPPELLALLGVVDRLGQTPLAGAYEVAGTTVDKTTGSERGLSGRLVVSTEGDTYGVVFDLTTTLVGSGEPQRAQLIGHGDGTIDARTLTGTAETQLIVALVPGVDAGFGMMPHGVSTRISNRSLATIAPDGSVEIEIESDPAPGETQYAPTRTTLRGRRLLATGVGGDE